MRKFIIGYWFCYDSNATRRTFPSFELYGIDSDHFETAVKAFQSEFGRLNPVMCILEVTLLDPNQLTDLTKSLKYCYR